MLLTFVNKIVALRLILLLIVSFLPFLGQAQLDSLLRVVSKLADSDTSKVVALNKLSNLLYRENSQKANEYAKKALSLAQKLNMPSETAKAYRIVGLNYFMERELAKAEEYYRKSISAASKVNDQLNVAHAKSSLALLFVEQGKNREALDIYHQTARLFDAKNEKIAESTCYTNMALAFMSLLANDSAVYYYRKSIDVSEKNNDLIGVAYGYAGIGDLYANSSRKKEAKEMYVKSLNWFQEAKFYEGEGFGLIRLAEALEEEDSLSKADSLYRAVIDNRNYRKNQFIEYYALMGLGRIRYTEKEFRNSLRYYKQALEHSKILGDAYCRGQALVQIANCHIKLDNSQEAIRYLDSAQYYANAVEDFYALRDIYKTYSFALENLGNYKKSVEFARKYEQLSDSIFTSEQAEKILQLQEIFESEQKQKEVELLKEKATQSETKIKLKNTLLYGSLALVLFALCFAYFFYYSKNKKQAQNQILTAKNAEIVSQQEEIQVQKELLENRLEKLEELAKEKNHLLGIVAHDLKSPLNQIQGLLDLIRLGGKDLDVEISKIHEMIGKTAGNMHELIAKILESQLSEFPKDSLILEKCNLVKLSEKTITNMQVLANKKNIGLVSEPAEFPTFVIADKRLLKQIFQNLISNAIKFSKPHKKVEILMRNKERSICWGIKDEGPGILPNEQPKLFKKFEPLSNKPTDNESSTGLGLFIVQKYASSMNATVWHENNPDRGSTFWVEFPKA